ncbi:zinc transporter ZupT [Mobilisporobacter senegalensis]
MNNYNFLFAFGITLFAGMATGMGSLLTLFIKRMDHKFLAGTLGFSAGVMMYVSTIEMFPEASKVLIHTYGFTKGYGFTIIAFFGGIALIAIIDRLIPSDLLPDGSGNNIILKKAKNSIGVKDFKMLRTGLFTVLVVALHNFPEGLVSFMTSLKNPALGASIGISIAIHNIPEGIMVFSPIYYATGSKRKAFSYSFYSGLTEPLGALIGYFLLYNFLNATTLGIILATVAGIMVYISIDELLPSAEIHGEHYTAVYGFIIGMAVMAMNVLLFS